MNIRQLENEDLPEITEMMKTEGVTDSLDFMNSDNTIVLEDEEIIGLLNWKFEQGYPSLRHFCFKRGKRKLEYIRLMLNLFKMMVKNWGYSKMIVNADKPYLCKLIEYYFKTKSYGNDENTYFYLCEV